jgi:hypothetical protein
MMATTKRALLLCLLPTLTGCAPTATSSNRPEDVLRAYAEAVSARDFDRAYGLMSDAFRKRYDRKEFVRLLKESPEEIESSIKQLRQKASTVQVEARVEYGESESLKLVVEDGTWKIASDPLDFYGQRTPAEALRSFVRALERRRYEIVLRFVPSRWAHAMTVDKLRQEWEGNKKDEVGTLIRNLKANLNAPIHQTGDTASMPYGDKSEVRFVREDGLWKIEDPD